MVKLLTKKTVDNDKEKRYKLLRNLDTVYQQLCEEHNRSAPRGGIPIGGGDWMDSFFKMEAIRGTITSLRAFKTLEESIAFGKSTSSFAVKTWNEKREYQVHRCEETAYAFLDSVVRRFASETF